MHTLSKYFFVCLTIVMFSLSACNQASGESESDETALTATETYEDQDNDKLTDNQETMTNTDPQNPDTDGDLLQDGDEVIIYGTDPLNSDTDGDGISDGDEVYTFETDPTNPVDSAVTAESTEAPTETAVPPTDVPTETPEPTDTPTPEPTATETNTPTAEATETPEATNTPAPKNTPQATAVPPTAVPPTAAPVTAHTFPETPIRPFDADDFIRYLGLVRDSYRSFNSEMDLFAQTNKPGDCGTFIGWTGLWILQAPGYTDVPADWQPLYAEYRSMLKQVVNVTAEIRPLCNAQGGELSKETTQAIVDFVAWAYPRSEAMITEANSLPK